MKTSLVLGFLFFALTACNGVTTQQSSLSAKRAPSSDAPAPQVPGKIVQTQTAQVVRVKNYNQYNMTLEKLTGLNRSKYNTLFEALKGSLPADNDISGLTPFNLIAMTRLADAYCFDFIDQHSKGALSGALAPLRPEDVKDFLFSRFLDLSVGEEKYASLAAEVDNVLSNDDGTGQKLFPNASGDLNGNKGLAIAACVTVLASPYVTLLE